MIPCQPNRVFSVIVPGAVARAFPHTRFTQNFAVLEQLVADARALSDSKDAICRGSVEEALGPLTRPPGEYPAGSFFAVRRSARPSLAR